MTVSIRKLANSERWVVEVDGVAHGFDLESDAIMYARALVKELQSAVDSAVMTYLDNATNWKT